MAAIAMSNRGPRIGASTFYRVYAEWADRTGLTGRERLSLTAFGRIMRERFTKDRTGATRLYRAGLDDDL